MQFLEGMHYLIQKEFVLRSNHHAQKYLTQLTKEYSPFTLQNIRVFNRRITLNTELNKLWSAMKISLKYGENVQLKFRLVIIISMKVSCSNETKFVHTRGLIKEVASQRTSLWRFGGSCGMRENIIFGTRDSWPKMHKELGKYVQGAPLVKEPGVLT